MSSEYVSDEWLETLKDIRSMARNEGNTKLASLAESLLDCLESKPSTVDEHSMRLPNGSSFSGYVADGVDSSGLT